MDIFNIFFNLFFHGLKLPFQSVHEKLDEPTIDSYLQEGMSQIIDLFPFLPGLVGAHMDGLVVNTVIAMRDELTEYFQNIRDDIITGL